MFSIYCAHTNCKSCRTIVLHGEQEQSTKLGGHKIKVKKKQFSENQKQKNNFQENQKRPYLRYIWRKELEIFQIAYNINPNNE